MKAMRRIVASFIAVLVFCFSGLLSPLYAEPRFDFPDPVGYVNDFANILSNDSSLEARLRTLDEEESTQVLVITMDSLPENVVLEEFVPFLTEGYPKWQAGQADKDNGVILVIVMETKEMRIDVGYGLEGALPDSTAKLILDNEVRPLFRNGDFNGGWRPG